MVKSVSWPTAEITGSVEAEIVRASASSLNAARSSIEPPPRAMMITSTLFGAIEIFDAGRDFLRRGFTLHLRGINLDADIFMAAGKNVEHVLQGRAARRSDKADASRQRRNGLACGWRQTGLPAPAGP